ncbi:MAG: rRNA maturation RNase YbeY [bacterium]|nr:rRNA maturation RNase YbeY [bacterium]
MNIEIRNFTKTKINEQLITGLAKKVLKSENGKIEELSIVIVGERRMRSLNKKYRKIDRPTDVLSFGDGVNEIFICPEKIKKGEFEKIFLHGLLHVLGYDHGELMEKKQNKYLKNK